jgi:hypothetical protein
MMANGSSNLLWALRARGQLRRLSRAEPGRFEARLDIKQKGAASIPVAPRY